MVLIIFQFSLSPKLKTSHNFLNPNYRHNEDGSYTYGFEGADGSFKIETKAQTGEVKGKYGYVDETGKVRTNSQSHATRKVALIPFKIVCPTDRITSAKSGNQKESPYLD